MRTMDIKNKQNAPVHRTRTKRFAERAAQPHRHWWKSGDGVLGGGLAPKISFKPPSFLVLWDRSPSPFTLMLTMLPP